MLHKKPTSVTEFVNAVPPFLAYALARTGKHGVSRKNKRPTWVAMVRRSGLSEGTFARMARRRHWHGVKVNVIDKFYLGCGVDPFHFGPQTKFLSEALSKGKKLQHLSERQWQKFRQQCRLANLERARITPAQAMPPAKSQCG